MIRLTSKTLLSKFEWLNNRLSRSQFLIISSILVGLLSGFAAILLKTIVYFIHILLSTKYILTLNSLIYLISPILGIFLTVLVVKVFFKGKLGRGISNILYEIANKSSFVHKDKVYSHIITSAITVGFGGSAGLESPIVVTGAAIGSNYSRLFHFSFKERTVLLAAGSAAGIAAVFDAPIAGIMFAIEVILPEIVAADIIPIIIAAVSSALLSKVILKEDILLYFQLTQHFNYFNVPYYIILGIFSGFLSLYYFKFFLKIENIFDKLKSGILTKAIIGGFLLGLLCIIFPPLVGEGYQSIKFLAQGTPEKILNNSWFEYLSGNSNFLILFTGLILLTKTIATSLTLSAGGNGGNFAPSLFMGAFSGFFFSRSMSQLFSVNLPESNFILVGMSGILSGVMHAPLTGIFLIAEVTGGYELMIPLMIVSSLSYLIVRYFEPFSMEKKKFASKGLIFTANRDKNILSQINVQNLIDKEIISVDISFSLRDLIELIQDNKFSTFSITFNGLFKGIVTLDSIREIMFNEKMYDKMTMKDILKIPKQIININDDIVTIMKKFDECHELILPVLNGNTCVGTISKASILFEYREILINQSGHFS